MLRALLLLAALGLIVVAAIPLAGDLAGVRLLAPGGPTEAGGEGPRVLLANNFVVAAFWAAGWLTLALLCAAAAVALDQMKRLLRLYRQLERGQAAPPQPARRAPEPAPTRRTPAEPRFEPRLATRNDPEAPSATERSEEAAARPRGPVLRADR